MGCTQNPLIEPKRQRIEKLDYFLVCFVQRLPLRQPFNALSSKLSSFSGSFIISLSFIRSFSVSGCSRLVLFGQRVVDENP
jgi:hypothetical protein